ncbi:hypothetical protein BDB01DRAFT_722452 [Pilobolus umbonatus]|nr:hypothetical protein BDB01DRAFT_722452 [Pilobolus umbonatus]
MHILIHIFIALQPVTLHSTSDSDTNNYITVVEPSIKKVASEPYFTYCVHTPKDVISGSLSRLTQSFISDLNQIIKSRDLFCSIEYPKSFSGEEAISVLHDIVSDVYTRKDSKRLVRSYMYSVPPLIAPVAYSEKSIVNNKLYDLSTEIYTLLDESASHDNLPQGLITSSLPCYSPLCRPDTSTNGCYSYGCPNKRKKSTSKNLHRNISMNSSVASSQDMVVFRCWSSHIPRDILQRTLTEEKKRQEAIYELIYTEEDYLRDLCLMEELFAKPLSKAQCIETSRRKNFCQSVFGNYMKLIEIHRDLFQGLHEYQQSSMEDGYFVDEIGKIFLKHLSRFKDAYIEYGTHYVHAEDIVAHELEENILFFNFLKETEKKAETRKLPFRHFVLLPITRLQRYPLLLDSILIKSKGLSTEQQNLNTCIQHIKEIATTVDRLAAQEISILRIRTISQQIRFKPELSEIDLELNEPNRKLVHEGLLKHKYINFIGESEYYIFLFDHLLLLTKKEEHPNQKNAESYIIWKEPIPLNYLSIHTPLSHSLSSSHLSSLSPIPPSTKNVTKLITGRRASINHPYNTLIIRHLNRPESEDIFISEHSGVITLWKDKLLKAQKELIEFQKRSKVFQLTPMRIKTVHDAYQLNEGKVTCVTSFKDPQNKTIIIFATQDGLWMTEEDHYAQCTKVLKAPHITQIGILPDENILLVLSDKTLIAYALCELENLMSAQSGYKSLKRSSEKKVLSNKISSHTSYFNTGTLNNESIVIVMKKRSVESNFKVFKATCGNLNNPTNYRFLAAKGSNMFKSQEWFKKYKGFYVGGDTSCAYFTKSKVVVRTSLGFEIINIEDLNVHPSEIPNIKHDAYSFIKKGNRPLNMFKCDDKYLLCYERCAFWMDPATRLPIVKAKRIEWNGCPHSVALYYPYLIAFTSKFIEIRHIYTVKIH